VRDGVQVVHFFHLLAVESFALAALAPVRLFAEYNGGRIPDAAHLRRRPLSLTGRSLSGVFSRRRACGAVFFGRCSATSWAEPYKKLRARAFVLEKIAPAEMSKLYSTAGVMLSSRAARRVQQ
jgi:hypothetical protein